MELALLGADRESISLAQAAVQLGHEIIWHGDTETAGENDLPGLSGEDQGDRWEVLLDGAVCDGVIVGRGAVSTDLRAEQLIQLVKNGVAVLTTFPVVDSVLSFYEIDMARGEGGAVVHHYNPLVEQQPILQQCALWVRQGHPELGAVEQILWDRPLDERTCEQVLWHFARDVELLQRVAGRLDRLGAHGSPEEQATYTGLSVQLLGESKTPVRWAVGPVEHSAWPRLVLVGQQGRLQVEFNESGRAVRMETSRAGNVQTSSLDPVPNTSAAVERFANAVAAGDSGSSTWPEALRAMELADTIEISLRRGRMIDVHPQQLTEQLAFRGTMSAVGCAVLLVLPPVLVALGWLAEQAGLPVAGYWPHALLLLLVVFLTLQLVPKFFFSSPTAEEDRHGDLPTD